MHRCVPHMHTRAQEDELTTTTRTAASGRCIEQDKNKKRQKRKRLLTGIIHTSIHRLFSVSVVLLQHMCRSARA